MDSNNVDIGLSLGLIQWHSQGVKDFGEGTTFFVKVIDAVSDITEA
jgi:hypothetical protein